MFCFHIWKKIKETYAPPVSTLFHIVESVSGERIERLKMGVTTILWECEFCQKIRKEELLGKEVKIDNKI